MNRHQARERAFQILFQLDLNEMEPKQAIREFFAEGREMEDPFLAKLIEGVSEHKENIDRIVSEQLVNWSFDRIATAEKTILRIAVYEMKYLEDIPKNVSINEAVELANTFGDEKSGKFVNGVLSKIAA